MDEETKMHIEQIYMRLAKINDELTDIIGKLGSLEGRQGVILWIVSGTALAVLGVAIEMLFAGR